MAVISMVSEPLQVFEEDFSKNMLPQGLWKCQSVQKSSGDKEKGVDRWGYTLISSLRNAPSLIEQGPYGNNKTLSLWCVFVHHFLVAKNEIIIVSTMADFKETAKGLAVFVG